VDPKAYQAGITEKHIPGAVEVAIGDVGTEGAPEGFLPLSLELMVPHTPQVFEV